MRKIYYFYIFLISVLIINLLILSSCGSSGSSSPNPVIVPPDDTENVTPNTYSLEGYILSSVESDINSAPLKIPSSVSYRIFLYKNSEDNTYFKEILANSAYFAATGLNALPGRIIINDFNQNIFEVEIDNTIPEEYINSSDISLKTKFFINNSEQNNKKEFGFLKSVKTKDKIIRNIGSGISDTKSINLEDINISSYTQIINITNDRMKYAEERIENEFLAIIKYSCEDLKDFLKTNLSLFPEFDLSMINIDILEEIIIPQNFTYNNLDNYLPQKPSNINIKDLKSFSCEVNWDIQQDISYTVYLNQNLIKDNIKDSFIKLNNLEQEKEYVINVYSNNKFGRSLEYAELSFKTPANFENTKILKSISVFPHIWQMYTLRSFDLRELSYYAVFDDNSKEKINNVTWNIFNGKGSIDSYIFNSPADTGETMIRVNYTKNNISKYSLFKISYSEKIKILKDIFLSEQSSSIMTTQTLDLSGIYLTKEYDNGTTEDTYLFDFFIKQGTGNIQNRIFTPEPVASTVILGVEIKDDNDIFTAEYEINVRKSLSSIEFANSQTTLNVNSSYDLALIKTIAWYDGQTTSEVTIQYWSMASGSGSIVDNIFYSPANVSVSTIKGTYTEDNIEQSAFFTIYTGKTLQRIVLSESSLLLPVETTFDMDDILITAEYDDNSSKNVPGLIWKKINGRGILQNNDFFTANNEGEALLRVEYEDDGIKVQADLIISIKFRPSVPTGLIASETGKNYVKLNWNSSYTDYQYNVYRDGIVVLSGISQPTCYISGLESGKEYEFNVTSVNVTGESGLSQKVSVITIPEPVSTFYTDSVTSRSISIHWDNISGASNYRVFLNSIEIDPINSENIYTFNNLIPGTLYFMQVQSENLSGKGDISQNYPVYTLLSPPQNINIPEIGDTYFKVSWNMDEKAESYKIYVDNVFYGTETVNNYLNILGRQAGEVYKVSILAVQNNTDGELSEPVNVIMPPEKTSGIMYSELTTSSLTLRWNSASGATYYRVRKNGSYTGNSTANNYLYISGLNAGSEYDFSVVSYNNSGTGLESDIMTIKTLPSKIAFVNSLDVTSSSLTLIWNSVPGSDSYNVYQDGNIIQSGITNTFFEITGLSPDTMYNFNVSAQNTFGEGESSATYTVWSKN